MTERDAFFANLRQALGRGPDDSTTPQPVDASLTPTAGTTHDRVHGILDRMEYDAEGLMIKLANTAERSGWNVARFPTLAAARAYVMQIARDLGARQVVRSLHPVLTDGAVDGWFAELGVPIEPMSITAGSARARQTERDRFRALAAGSDIGVTGVDYAIAETGTCVLLPRAGVSRLVSLLPPVHIAIVQRGEVLPSLDELFAMQRRDHLDGELGSYLTLISGPSRSADIEYTLVTGVHGPGQVHMVLIG
ncbi:MAG: lactate utilization protein [SAR202 cluster bacterium]|nr:lactate utilization protein [SAR202 cluster bacterium]